MRLRLFLIMALCLAAAAVYPVAAAQAALTPAEKQTIRTSMGYTASLAAWLQSHGDQLQASSAAWGQSALSQCQPLLKRGLIGPWSTADMDDIYHNLLASGAHSASMGQVTLWLDRLQSTWRQAAIHPWWAGVWQGNLNRIRQILHLQQSRLTSPGEVCDLAVSWDRQGWLYNPLPQAVSNWQRVDLQTYSLPVASAGDASLLRRLIALAGGKHSTGLYLYGDQWNAAVKQQVQNAACADPLLDWAYAGA